ncbi:LORF2 protein, partial [Crocuta crocuta]
ETVWRFLKKLKTELSYNPAIALFRYVPKCYKKSIQWDTCTPTFMATLSTTAQLWKGPKCPSTDEWRCGRCHTHTHTQWNDSVIKKEILPSAIWMDLEGTMLSEMSQSEKDKYHMISLICGI